MEQKRQRILDCKAAENAVHDVLHGLDHEEVWVLFLTCDNRVITKEMVSKGTLTGTTLDNRTVIRRALLNNAYGIVLLHNHPSGNPIPSVQDIQFTAGMRKACDLMDINLMDHIITGDDCFFSFSEDRTINM